jgi:ketosteroid isomerase-like protein
LLFLEKSGNMQVGAETSAGKIMTKAEIEGIIRKLYAARIAGNVEDIVGAMASNVSFGLAGDPTASSVVGRLSGSEPVRAQLTKLVKGFKFNSYEIVTLVVDGSNAAVHGKASITSMATGQTVDTDLADFIAFKDGRVTSFTQFCDTALASKLAPTS